jgi:hypothetical protein
MGEVKSTYNLTIKVTLAILITLEFEGNIKSKEKN